jgi:hypothetical protein
MWCRFGPVAMATLIRHRQHNTLPPSFISSRQASFAGTFGLHCDRANIFCCALIYFCVSYVSCVSPAAESSAGATCGAHHESDGATDRRVSLHCKCHDPPSKSWFHQLVHFDLWMVQVSRPEIRPDPPPRGSVAAFIT